MPAPDQQFAHAVLPTATHDERAREAIVRALRRNVVAELVPSITEAWNTRVKEQFDEPPATRAAVRAAMLEDAFVQQAFSLRRIVQEQTWDATAEIVERQIEELNERGARRRVDQRRHARGGLDSVGCDSPLSEGDRHPRDADRILGRGHRRLRRRSRGNV